MNDGPTKKSSGNFIGYRTCPLCEATCGLEITVQDGKAVKVRGDSRDVFSKGYICPKGAGLVDLHNDPDRLRRPLVRKNGEFQEVSWDEAFAAVADGIKPIIEKHGPEAVAVYLGNPCAHTLGGALAMRPLLKAIKTKNIYSASTVDQMPKHVSSGLMFGGPTTIPVPDIDRTDYLVIIGGNPLVSNGSLATAPDWPGRLARLRERGGKLVVIDPFKTKTAETADKHLPIKPGGDPLLLLALSHVLFEENLVNLGPPADHVNGLEHVRKLVLDYPPEKVEDSCGINSLEIRELARELAAAPSAAVYGRMGASTVEFGTIANWLVDVVNILTGNLDKPGGAMFTRTAHFPDKKSPGGKGWKTGRWQSRVKGFNEVLGELPVGTLCDEIETPGAGQVRSLLTIASNPVIALPNAARMDRALAGLDFMVSVDFYVTASTRHAHVILPPTGPLSTAHYDAALYNMAVRNIANYSQPLLPIEPGEMDKWEILYRLALIFGGQPPDTPAHVMDDFVIQMMVGQAASGENSPFKGKENELLEDLKKYEGPDRVLDFMLRTGAYGDGFGLNPEGLSLSKLTGSPHGLDLGPLQPRLPNVLKTPSAKIEMAPGPIMDDLERMNASFNKEKSDLLLIGRRHLRTNNSWMCNIPTLASGPPRWDLYINPRDAQRLNIIDKQQVKIESRVGSVVSFATLTDKIRPGVVSLPHGWGHDLPGVKMKVAREYGGVNSNILTDDLPMDAPSGTSVLNGIPVTVTPI